MTTADRVELARLPGILADDTAAAPEQLDEPAGRA
jgi:hypothetical protein